MALIHYIRRHRKKLVVIGASTVFATFVVKDGLREKAKDQLAAVEKARSIFQEAVRQSEMKEYIVAISIAVNEKTDTRGTKGTYTVGSLWSAFDQRAYETQAGEEIEALTNLENALPPDAETAGAIRDANTAWENLIKTQTLFTLAEHNHDDTEAANREQRSFAKLVQKAHDDMAVAASSAWLHISNRAMTEHHRRQKRYELFDRLSYILFGFGWAVGLVGEFAKEEKSQTAAEKIPTVRPA